MTEHPNEPDRCDGSEYYQEVDCERCKGCLDIATQRLAHATRWMAKTESMVSEYVFDLWTERERVCSENYAYALEHGDEE